MALAAWTSVPAQDTVSVILKSFDGFAQLPAKLVDFDGAVCRIETDIGVTQVDVLLVNCESDHWPEDILFGVKFGIAGSNTIGTELML